MQTTFPDKRYLRKLINHIQEEVGKAKRNQLESLVSLSGVAMNWIADYITDPNINWRKQLLLVDRLYLTGTNPTWNKIVIDRCGRSPQKLREYLKKNKKAGKIFLSEKVDNTPILVRFEEGEYKVLDGIHRVIATIRSGEKTITAFVARPGPGKPSPVVEPHVVYDLLKAYQRGLNKDRKSLVTSLRFLKEAYGNVEQLIRERFSRTWVSSDEIQEIMKEVLEA
jgi:hypothetical protein